LKAGYKAGPEHPCSLCGRLTDSSFPMCSRQDTGCRIEYQRAQLADGGYRQRRNERVSELRQRQKGDPSVYAVWFPVPGILKVGFTTDMNNGIFVGVARTRAKRRDWAIEGSSCTWKQPGDLRTEAWMQATLAFRWRSAFEQRSMKICEWFLVPGLTEDEIGHVLDEVYKLVPADTVKQPVATLF
jgi:hypothetical protein